MKQEGEMKILRVENKNEDRKRRNENQFTIAKSASTSLPGMKSHARIFFSFLFVLLLLPLLLLFYHLFAFSTFRVSLVPMATLAG